MPTWLKVVLVVMLVGILLVFGALFIGFRWMKSRAGELQADAAKMKAEATLFGQGKDPNACVDETFARLSRCDGIFCEVKIRVFLASCVDASNVPEGFCASLPKRNEIMATAHWATAECARRGRANDQRCTRVIQGLQDYCSRP